MARNNTQVYKGRVLAMVYGEQLALKLFWTRINQVDVDRTLRVPLERLYLLYGLSNLEKHIPYFYEANVANSSLVKFIRDGILQLCDVLKPDAVALTDAFGMTDYAIGSILGNADGKVS